METEFNLSEKIKQLFEIEYLDSMADVQGDVTIILKEFIKILKEEFNGEYQDITGEEVSNFIDKLAGKELVD